MEQVEKSVLPNGVRVLTEHVPSVRSISLGIYVATGSRDEAAEESGLSHFIEHMVFKGTRKRRMHHIAQRMESVGGYLNAFTTKECTCYYTRALDEHLARGLDTVADLVTGPVFPEKEIEKEKDVVLEEMKMYEDAPEELIFDRFEAALFPEHPMGRPIVGFPETVRAFDREAVVGYLQKAYAPDRLVLSAAGHVKHRDVLRLAERALGAAAPSAAVLPPREPPRRYAPTEQTEQRPIQQAHLVLGRRGYDVRHERRSALSLLNTLLGGGMSSRLNQNIRERYGFCYNVYSFANMHSDSGDFGVYMGTDAGKVGRARALILRELDRLAQEPVSARALEQAKSQVKGAMLFGLESMSNRMMRLGRQELQLGRFYSMDDAMAEIQQITADDVLAVAQDLFQPDTFSTYVLTP